MRELSKETDKFGVTVRNLRITQFAVEFDLFSNNISTEKAALRDLVAAYGPLLDAREIKEERNTHFQSIVKKEEILKTFIKLFNEERYWECHEKLEQIWRQERDAREKDLLQGLILGSSALVHAQKNEVEVCLRMIEKSLAKLERWEETSYYGLNVAHLRSIMRDIHRTGNISLEMI